MSPNIDVGPLRNTNAVLLAATLSCLGLGVACSSRSSGSVESDLVGTWELYVPTPSGPSHWIWEIHADGSYDFHAEGAGNAPAHSGTFTAANGQYSLDSTTVTVNWHDKGTYQLTQPDTMWAAGKAGVAAWHRISARTVNDNGPAPPAAPVLSAQERRLCNTLGQYRFEPKRPFSYGPDGKPDFSDLPPGDVPGVACRIRYNLYGPNRSLHSILYVVFRSQPEADQALKADSALDKSQKIVATLAVAETARCMILSTPDHRQANACETLKSHPPGQGAYGMPPVLVLTQSPATQVTAGIYDLPLQLDRGAAGEIAAAWEMSN